MRRTTQQKPYSGRKFRRAELEASPSHVHVDLVRLPFVRFRTVASTYDCGNQSPAAEFTSIAGLIAEGRDSVMAEEPYNPSPIGNPSVLARRNWFQTQLVIFIGKHTPKCREMVRILSRSMDEPMPLTMRIKKRLHFLICCWCQRYERQLRYIHKTAGRFPEHADEASDVPFPPDAKERIRQRLAENIR